MKNTLLILALCLTPLLAGAQPWSAFLDPSRAVDWTTLPIGFSIPNYTVACATQPTLTANDITAAPANTTAIQNALASCDSTHNVVNLPAGTYYVASWTYGSQGYQVVRGASVGTTTVLLTDRVGCTGLQLGPCMMPSTFQNWAAATQMPPSGTQQCYWTAGFAQGTTSITLSNCGGVPTTGTIMMLDQANDASDNGGAFLCDSYDYRLTVAATTGFSGGKYITGVTSGATARITAIDPSYTALDIVGVSGTFSASETINETATRGGTADGNSTTVTSQISSCTVENPGDADGPQYTDNITHSEQQVVWVTGVSGGSGTYTVTISPGVLFPNFRHHTEYTGTLDEWPHARWQAPVISEGLENLTIQHDATELYVASKTPFTAGKYVLGVTSGATGYIIRQDPYDVALDLAGVQGGPFTTGETIDETPTRNGTPDGNSSTETAQSGLNTSVALMACYECWVKNVREIYSGRDDVYLFGSYRPVIRDNYFYEAQAHGSQSYGVEFEVATGALVENNIFHVITNPIMMGQGSGNVIDYNYALNEGFNNASAQTSDAGHNAGNGFNLFEGNNFFGIWTDDSWGSNYDTTIFRNSLRGWQSGKTNYTNAETIGARNRAMNVVGNILGQPSYHTLYQSYATSTSTGVNIGSNLTVYALGWSDINGCTYPTNGCDPLAYSTLMRWGNWDTVNAATQWNSTEASPAAVAYINANFTSTYFSTLAQTLPNSLFYTTKPAWWPSGKAWPPIGPDVSAGNVGICSTGSTYAGAPATSSGQCTGGTLTAAWASHVISIPAQDCYLNVMSGPPDGSDAILSFDANTCYYGSAPAGTGASPQLLMARRPRRTPLICKAGHERQRAN